MELGPGKACGDPELDLTVQIDTVLRAKGAVKCFHVPLPNYQSVYGQFLGDIWSWRHDVIIKNFQMFQDWDYTQLRNLCAEAKDRIL